MKFLICALLNHVEHKNVLCTPNRQLFLNAPPEAPQATPEDAEEEDAHLKALEDASQKSPLELAAALEDSLVALGAQAAKKETEEIGHGRGELGQTLVAMGATKEEQAEALARYDEQFKGSEEELTGANEKDRKEWEEKLKTGALNVREQRYRGEKAVADDYLNSLGVALRSADSRIRGKEAEIRGAERAFGDAKKGLESEAGALFGKKMDFATLKDTSSEDLSKQLGTILKERGMKAGLPITDAMAKEMAHESVQALKAKVEGVNEVAINAAKDELANETTRKERLQTKKSTAETDRATLLAEYDKDVHAIKEGTYVLPGGEQTLNETAHTIADATFTPEELELLHSYTQKSGEMVRTLTLEVAGKRIQEKRDELQEKLEGSEAYVSVRESFLRSGVKNAEAHAREVASRMGESWEEVKDFDEAQLKERMTTRIKGRAEKAGLPLTEAMVVEMVTEGYMKFAGVKTDYEAAVRERDNDSSLAFHQRQVEQTRGEITRLDEYLERDKA